MGMMPESRMPRVGDLGEALFRLGRGRTEVTWGVTPAVAPARSVLSQLSKGLSHEISVPSCPSTNGEPFPSELGSVTL